MGKYLKMPYIPDKHIKRILIDQRTPKQTIKYIKELDIEIVYSPVLDELYEAVCGHSDLFIHHINDNVFVSSPNTYEYYSEVLEVFGFTVLKGYKEIKRTYPDNIAYNIARVGNIAFHNTKYTDRKIIELFEELDVKIVHVNQGYTKCSVCIVSENGIITSDKGICNAAEKYNIDVLLIEQGFFILPGLNYGFIGGVSGLISNNELLFTGNIKLHPDYHNIINFCKKHKKTLIFPEDVKCIDVGSVIPLCYC